MNPALSRAAAAVYVLVVCAFSFPGAAFAAGRGEPGTVVASRVEIDDRAADLDAFHRMDLDVDGVFDGWARIYLLEEEALKLGRMGYRVSALPEEPRDEPLVTDPPIPGVEDTIPTTYHTYATLTAELDAIATARTDLTRLYTLGQSVQGRQLWMMKISLDPDVESDEPEVAFVAAMHGDEVVGKELCIEFIHYLLDGYDASDPWIVELLESAVIWIMPSMNPDGTELVQRYNSNGFDLNRSFPDWFSDPVNSTVGRQPEVRAIMDWAAQQSITLSANFHGGALVANYPWDNNETESSGVFSPTDDPDQDAFESISLTYAENNPPMYASTSFSQGVTNGAEWYVAVGGMQDWSYAWYGKWDVTLEISEVKWPSASQLPTFWDQNRQSMLSYLERALEGVRGLVTDAATGAPVAAEIRLATNPFAVFTDPAVGDYHRIVLPGTYDMHVSAPGYYPQTVPVTVTAGPAVRYDLALQPLPADLQPIAGRIEDGGAGNGQLDPGETADLAVTLKNLGSPATTISGRLVPTGWFGQVVQPDATYPDLGIEQSGESDAPYYVVHLDPLVPVGHQVGYAIEWSADQGGGMSEPFFLPVGVAACADVDALDVPQSILDYQTTTSQLTVAAGALLDEVRVTVDISHTYIGDLILTLISPEGTEVVLHDRSGSGTDDIVGTYGDDLKSAEPLSAFAGEVSVGTWTLTVSDGAGGDVGTLNAWNLENCGHAVEAQPPEMRFRRLEPAPGSVTLDWWPYPGMGSYRVYRSSDATSGAAFVDVTAEDGDPTDTSFVDGSVDPLVYYLVTGVGASGEGPKGHYGE